MLLVLLLAAAIWVLGHLMGAPRDARGLMVGLLFVAVLGIQIIFPEAHPLREATGGSAALWLIFAGFVALVMIYRVGLRALQSRAAEAEQARAPTNGAPFSDVELNRYARHIVLREIGGAGQKRLKDAKVLVVGAGGLGAPVLQYLAAAGVGTLGVIDDDTVENANLQRQVIHKDAAIGMPKVFSAVAQIKAQNPFVAVKPYNRRFTADIADELVAEYDLVLDGVDNFDTRYAVNRACVAAGVPLISGALSQWEGQLTVFDPSRSAPCYECIFPESPADGLAPSCAEAGVIGPLPGVVGSMMAVEAIKLITGAGNVLLGQMVIYDALYGESRRISLNRRADCPVCSPKIAELTGEMA
ncbi:MAG: molybdopterin-synthase adenylyltransferase MoeB [Pseudomonadota bacterium]